MNGAAFGVDSKTETKTLTFAADKEVSISGGVFTSATTAVSASGAQINVTTGSDENKETVYANVDLGAITIAAGKTSSNSLKITNTGDADGTNAVKAASLTIAAADKENANAGAFTLKGNMEVGALSVAASGTVTVGENADVAKLTLTGASTNAGTVTLGTAGALTIAKDATFDNSVSGASVAGSGSIVVAGTLTNYKAGATATNGTIAGTTLTLAEGGVVDSNMGTDYAVTTTTLDGGVFQTSLNVLTDGKDPGDTAATALKLEKAFVLKGGKFVTRGTESKDIDSFVLATGGSIDVQEQQDQKFASIMVSGGSFAVTNSTVAVDNLNVQDGSATVSEESSINVGKLTVANGKTVNVYGKLSTSAHALGLQVSGQAFAGDSSSGAGSVAANGITLGQNATLVLTDYAETSTTIKDAASLASLTAKVSGNGVIDIGNVTITGLVSDKNEVKFSDLASIQGVTTNGLKAAKVTGVNKVTHSASWGSIALGDGLTSATVSGSTLTLNGAGQLVTYKLQSGTETLTKLGDVSLTSGAGLVVAGTSNTEKASVGSVTSADNTTTFLAVVDGRDLTVEGDVKVAELDVNKDSKLTVVQSKNEGAEAPAVEVNDLQVAGNFEAAASKVVVSNDADTYYDGTKFNEVSQVAGTAAVKDLTVNGDFLVTGSATVMGDLTVGAGKKVYVGNNEAAGTMIVGNLASGSVFADPAWDVEGVTHSKLAVKTAGEDTTVEAGRNSIVSLGTTDVSEAESLLSKSGYVLADTPREDDEANGVKAVSAIDTHTVNSVLYVNGGKTVAEGGAVSYATYLGNAIAGNDTIEQHDPHVAGIYVAKNSMLAIDLNTVDTTGETAVFDKDVTLEHDSILFLDNVANGNQVKLSAGELSMDGAEAVFEGDLLMEVVSVEGAGNEGKFGIQMLNKDDLSKFEMAGLAGFDAAYGMFEEGKNLNNNSSSAQFNKWLYSTTTSPVWQKFSDGSYDVNLADLKKITTDVASLGATTGVQTLTMDAVNQMADTVATRNSILTQRAQGVNVWVDVNGGKFEAKKLFDGAGYSSDIYSGVLGLDYQFSCNAVLGAALTIGTADTDSKNSGVAASTDTDLVGFSVYASKTFADIWNVAADIGYMSASNDVTANGYNHAWKFSQDTDAFTVGVRGEVLTKAGAVNIVPHVGLRYTQLSTDGFEAGYVTDIDDQNIFQMPVGVALSADFETNGWTLAPKFDLSVVPTFGDKDADLKLGINGVSATDDLSVRVIDSNPVQATLGINATNGDWGFGLSYKLGVGSDERMNNSFNAQVRYAF